MATTWDFCNIWLEVHGIIVPAPVADFLLSYLHWFDDGNSGTCQAEAPLGWDLQDLCTLGYLVANKEVESAQKLIDSLPSPPMVMLPSSTLMGGNNNHLKKNPFRKRRSGKKRKQAAQSVEQHDSTPGDDSSKGDVSKCGGDIDEIIGQDNVDGSEGEGDFECSKGDGNKCQGDDGRKSKDHVDCSKNVGEDTRDDADGKSQRASPVLQVC